MHFQKLEKTEFIPIVWRQSLHTDKYQKRFEGLLPSDPFLGDAFDHVKKLRAFVGDAVSTRVLTYACFAVYVCTLSTSVDWCVSIVLRGHGLCSSDHGRDDLRKPSR